MNNLKNQLTRPNQPTNQPTERTNTQVNERSTTNGSISKQQTSWAAQATEQNATPNPTNERRELGFAHTPTISSVGVQCEWFDTTTTTWRLTRQSRRQVGAHSTHEDFFCRFDEANAQNSETFFVSLCSTLSQRAACFPRRTRHAVLPVCILCLCCCRLIVVTQTHAQLSQHVGPPSPVCSGRTCDVGAHGLPTSVVSTRRWYVIENVIFSCGSLVAGAPAAWCCVVSTRLVSDPRFALPLLVQPKQTQSQPLHRVLGILAPSTTS